MIESPEGKHLRETIESHIKPLKEDIQSLREQVKRVIPKVPTSDLEKLQEGVDEPEERISLFEDILRKTPLYTRVKVYLEMEYLNAILQEDCCTDEMMNEASQWSMNVTKHLLRTLKEWEIDGRPGELPGDLPDIKVPIG